MRWFCEVQPTLSTCSCEYRDVKFIKSFSVYFHTFFYLSAVFFFSLLKICYALYCFSEYKEKGETANTKKKERERRYYCLAGTLFFSEKTRPNGRTRHTVFINMCKRGAWGSVLFSFYQAPKCVTFIFCFVAYTKIRHILYANFLSLRTQEESTF